MQAKDKKTLKTLLIFLGVVLAVALIYNIATGQAADTSYMVEIDANGDSTCFLLVGDVKGEVDCATALKFGNVPPPVLDSGNDPVDDVVVVKDAKKTPIDIIKLAWAFLVENWYILILPLLEIIVRLIPGEKDNNILRIIQSWLDKIIPNNRAGGGRFVAFEDRESAPKLGLVSDKKLPDGK